MYSILYDQNKLLRKDFEKLSQDSKYAKCIKGTIESFAQDPQSFLGDIKKLQPSSDHLWRIRVGNYRIIFSLDFGNRVMIVHRIGLRKDIYK